MHRAPSLLLVLLVLIGCNGGTEPTPGPSTIGEPFASITIGGKSWKPERTTFLFLPGRITVGFARPIPGTSVEEDLTFLLPAFATPITYALSDTGSLGTYGQWDTSMNSGYFITTSPLHPGVLQITGFDPSDTTIAGTFRFVLFLDVIHPTRETAYAGSFRVRPSQPQFPTVTGSERTIGLPALVHDQTLLQERVQ